MGIGDPIVKVYCDECGAETEVDLTALCNKNWDTRNVDETLAADDWIKVGDDLTFCSVECQEEFESKNEIEKEEQHEADKEEE